MKRFWNHFIQLSRVLKSEDRDNYFYSSNLMDCLNFISLFDEQCAISTSYMRLADSASVKRYGEEESATLPVDQSNGELLSNSCPCVTSANTTTDESMHACSNCGRRFAGNSKGITIKIEASNVQVVRPTNVVTAKEKVDDAFKLKMFSDSGEHCHDDEHRHVTDNGARRKLWIASLLCVVFMIGEAVGGLLAGSLAVATDAAHLLTDFAGFMISLFALYISERPATKTLSYGYHRAEVIGALTSVLLIWVVTGILVYLAVQRVVMQEFEINAPIMLITSGIGLINGMYFASTWSQPWRRCQSWTQPQGHGHSHNAKPKTTAAHANGGFVRSVEDPENTDHTDPKETSCESDSSSNAQVAVAKPNINVRAAFIHVVGDFLQSVGVFAAALTIYFEPTWVIIDPICTFLFSILVIGTTFAIIKDTLVVLMEGIPKGIDFNEVRETLLQVKGVYIVHNLRIWSLSMDKIAMSAHLAVEPGSSSANSILRKSSQLVKSKYGFCEVTIQIEDFNQSMQDCRKCQELNY
ncbi:Zinc transporter 2 [Orchesella cincta]|uniref:Zinc transporter 2 n=1 Tax=Orchesella cincta TaxID=48709 RepID=A0A1D2MP54_ORCCI|nr:Zinc transporter 2 [Orchesella cincta]